MKGLPKFSIIDLQPVLETNDMHETLKFYKDKLGFNIDFKWPMEETLPPTHAGMSLGDSSHSSDDHNHIHLQLSLSKEFTSSGWLYITIGPEIEELFVLYKNRGVEIVSELTDQPWNMKEFDIRDNNGHTIRFGYNYQSPD